MIYIFGPYAAGKREYVRETFGYTEADFSTKAEDNCRVLYDAQQLVSKVGNRPEELEKLAGGRPMHVVGDCKAPREVANAIRAAYVTAMQIC